jgi:hypothetical protein
VLVFFDSEKVGFCFVVSNFLSPFPFEVFFFSSLSVILEGWGGGGGHPEAGLYSRFVL